jgi:hypothetical protein
MWREVLPPVSQFVIASKFKKGTVSTLESEYGGRVHEGLDESDHESDEQQLNLKIALKTT